MEILCPSLLATAYGDYSLPVFLLSSRNNITVKIPISKMSSQTTLSRMQCGGSINERPQHLPIVFVHSEPIIDGHIRIQSRCQKGRTVGTPFEIPTRVISVKAQQSIVLPFFDARIVVKGHFARQIPKPSAPQKPSLFAVAVPFHVTSPVHHYCNYLVQLNDNR